MKLTIRHITRYAYDPPVSRMALRLRLFPSTCSGQRVEAWSVTVGGDAVEPLLTEAHGDKLGLWLRHRASDGVEIVAEGIVHTEDCAGVCSGLPDITRPGVWLRETPLTEVDDAVRDLAAGIAPGEPLTRLHALSAAVSEAVQYRPGATDPTTTAAEALAIGAGVCQDQSHVFVAAARAMDIPARYVVGYLLTGAVEDAMAPENETHAWAEAHVPGLGWTGFDPTHGICPTDAYVRLASGLDAAEAAPVRGSFSGDSEETLDAEVLIAQAGGQSQQ